LVGGLDGSRLDEIEELADDLDGFYDQIGLCNANGGVADHLVTDTVDEKTWVMRQRVISVLALHVLGVFNASDNRNGIFAIQIIDRTITDLYRVA
jgi:hypothetical protein